MRAWKNVDLPTLGSPTIPDYPQKNPLAYRRETNRRELKEENRHERDSIVGGVDYFKVISRPAKEDFFLLLSLFGRHFLLVEEGR